MRTDLLVYSEFVGLCMKCALTGINDVNCAEGKYGLSKLRNRPSLFQVNWKVVLSNLRIYPIVWIQNTISLNQSNLLLSANEVVGKVMFLHVSVICSEGESACTGVCLGGGCASRGWVCQQGELRRTPPLNEKSWQYASYWNAFLLVTGRERLIRTRLIRSST